MKGTLLNTATVAGGAALGMLVGANAPDSYMDLALAGLGLVTMGTGIRLFLKGENILATAIAVALGGILGLALGFQAGLEMFAEWAKGTFGGTGRFTEAIVATSILFCVGPMTLLGCIQDGLEGKSELLALKSIMDGIAAFFFAAAMGPGVLVTAVVLFLFQGGITLAAKRLRKFAENQSAVAEMSAAGGAILLATSIGLMGVKSFPTANFLPALVLAPIIAEAMKRIPDRLNAA